MNERDRILALVREGIITTEEALVLLENLAKREGKDAVKFNQQQDFTDTPDSCIRIRRANRSSIRSRAGRPQKSGKDFG